MLKNILGGVLFLLAGAALAQDKLSPQGCDYVAMAVYNTAEARGTITKEKQLEDLAPAPEGPLKEISRVLINTIYLSKKASSEDLATDFLKKCYDSGGDLNKIKERYVKSL